jgi:hypothetical protein
LLLATIPKKPFLVGISIGFNLFDNKSQQKGNVFCEELCSGKDFKRNGGLYD